MSENFTYLNLIRHTDPEEGFEFDLSDKPCPPLAFGGHTYIKSYKVPGDPMTVRDKWTQPIIKRALPMEDQSQALRMAQKRLERFEFQLPKQILDVMDALNSKLS